MYIVIIRTNEYDTVSRTFEKLHQARSFLKDKPTYMLLRETERAPYGNRLIEEKGWNT